LVTPDKKLLVIVGPTAVGKTAVALRLANHFKTGIISADSRQIFRELKIGTAKPTSDDLAAVPHYFINSHSIHETFDAAQFGLEALALIHRLFVAHDHLILCGGSGLYVRAVCEGFDEIPPIAEEIREELMKEYAENGIGSLQATMQRLDPDLAGRIDLQNPQRLIRALEVIRGTGKSISSYQKQKKLHHPFSIVKIGLEVPREELNLRIDARMDEMITEGLFDEAQTLLPFRNNNALQTVGYQEIFDFFDGKYDKAEAIRLLKRNSRRYAKRQMTWFRRDREIVWVNPANIDEILANVNR